MHQNFDVGDPLFQLGLQVPRPVTDGYDEQRTILRLPLYMMDSANISFQVSLDSYLVSESVMI